MTTNFVQAALLTLVLSLFYTPHQAQDVRGPNLDSPGDEHRRLDGLVGTWDVSVSFPLGPGKTGQGRSSLDATWVMDGRFVRQEYASTFMSKPLSVVRYLGFDRYKGKVVEIQFESTHTDVMQNEGTISPDGKTVTTFGEHVDTAAGRSVRVRSLTTFVDADTFTTELFYDEGSPNAKKITLTHRRKKI